MGLRVETVMTGIQGAPYYNALNFTGTTQLNATNAALAVQAFWGDLAAQLHQDVSIQVQPQVVAYNDQTGQPDAAFNTGPHEAQSGAVDSPLLPFTTQGLISWRTGSYVAGREVRGRTFIPGMTEASNNLGMPESGALTVFQTAATALINDADSNFAIWSPKNGSTVIVISGTPWTQWGSLRSRRD